MNAPAKALTPRQILVGSAWALFAVSIWAGWMVVTRLDLLSSGLNEFDITAIRSAAVLAPVAARHGILARSVGWTGTLLLVCGAGVPYVLVASAGLALAPASDAGPLMPGVMPLFAAALSVLVLRERINRSRLFGLGLIPLGAALIAGTSLASGQSHRWLGDLLLVCGAFLWATFTVTIRRAGLAALTGAAIVATWSAILFLPVYVLMLPKSLNGAGWLSLLQQVVFQGVLTSVVSLVAFNRAIALLGASRTAVFASLVPALATLLAIPVLGERPGALPIAGIVVITIGVLFGSGALKGWAGARPSPGRRVSSGDRA